MGAPPLFQRQLVNWTPQFERRKPLWNRSETACTKNELPLIKPPLSPDERNAAPPHHIYGPFNQEISSQKIAKNQPLQEAGRKPAPKKWRRESRCREEKPTTARKPKPAKVTRANRLGWRSPPSRAGSARRPSVRKRQGIKGWRQTQSNVDDHRQPREAKGAPARSLHPGAER